MKVFSCDDLITVEKKEVKRGLAARSLIQSDNGPIWAADEHYSVLYLDKVMEAGKRIRYFKGDVCKLVTGWRGNQVVRMNRLGNSLLSVCKDYERFMTVWIGKCERQRYDHHRLHPYIDVVMKAVSEVHADVVDVLGSRNQQGLYEVLSKLFTDIHRQTNSEGFRKAVRNFERNSEAKFRRALEYVGSLFEKRSRLLFLRVDLYVREEGKLWSYTAEVDAAFDKFAADLSRGAIVPGMVGWMSSREEGLKRGRHYHVIVFLDGHEHRAGANLSKMIGEYWVTECVGTERVGSYFNCFSRKGSYEHPSLGVIHCADKEKLPGLFYATRYLCKSDVQLIAKGGGSRNFRRGVIDRDYVRSGAPRTRGGGESLVKQGLLGLLAKTQALEKSQEEALIQRDAEDRYSWSSQS